MENTAFEVRESESPLMRHFSTNENIFPFSISHDNSTLQGTVHLNLIVSSQQRTVCRSDESGTRYPGKSRALCLVIPFL